MSIRAMEKILLSMQTESRFGIAISGAPLRIQITKYSKYFRMTVPSIERECSPRLGSCCSSRRERSGPV